MILDKMSTFAKEVLKRSSGFWEAGKDIIDFGKRRIRDLEETKESTPQKKAQKIMKKTYNASAEEREVRRREQSMLHSQGISDHSGSSYHGPNKPGERANDNKLKRNFDNHQGN